MLTRRGSRARFNAQEIVKLRDDFSMLDTNRDGVLTIDDVVEAIKKRGLQGDLKDEDVQEFFKTIVSKNKHGYIEFNDYMDFMVLVKRGGKKLPKVVKLFEQSSITIARSGGGV